LQTYYKESLIPVLEEDKLTFITSTMKKLDILGFVEACKHAGLYTGDLLDSLEQKAKKIRVVKVKSLVPLLSKAIKTIDLNKSKHKARIRNSP